MRQSRLALLDALARWTADARRSAEGKARAMDTQPQHAGAWWERVRHFYDRVRWRRVTRLAGVPGSNPNEIRVGPRI